ncbi:hypothetical protein LNP74_04960 [Klebsiella pneumoniae subsp. pneumoniae]|nr:hypothetical protein [Klebsiella pneumoniae subsp. pneumoniae]
MTIMITRRVHGDLADFTLHHADVPDRWRSDSYQRAVGQQRQHGISGMVGSRWILSHSDFFVPDYPSLLILPCGYRRVFA